MQIILVAGPNGAGKSTSAPALVPNGVPYINADEIAKQLPDTNSNRDIAPSRMLLKEWERLAELAVSFGIEITLASRSLAPKIRRLQEACYEFVLYFFWLPSPELAIARVAERVRLGGHHIPENVIRRRYEAGWRNFFEIYQPLTDHWEVYANLKRNQSVFVAQGQNSKTTIIANHRLWQQINQKQIMRQDVIKEEQSDYFSDWRTRERAVQKAIQAAILEHKNAENPIAEWQDDQVVIVQPEDIDVNVEMIADLG